MNGARHKNEPANKGLVVKGTGYVSPYRQTQPLPQSVMPTRKPHLSNMRRAGSVGNVASTSRASSRVPLVPQAPSRTSYHNGDGHYMNGHYHDHHLLQPVICNCQHPASLEFLENVYVQNLQTQIEILELENSYLRTGGTAPSNSTDHRPQVPSRPILREREDSSGSFDRASDRTVIHRPPLVPERPAQDRDRAWSSVPSTSSQYRKRVEFQEDRRSPTKSPPKRTSITGTRQDTSEEDALFEKLEESIQREQLLEERLKSTVSENERLESEKQRLEERLEVVSEDVQKFEERLSKERRTLMEENVELQRRLDELTPLLAEKEAQIVRLNDEKEATSSRLRNMTLQYNNLQSTVNELKREESFHSELESSRKQEVERLSDRIRQLEDDLEEQKQREIGLLDELFQAQRKIKEQELQVRKERSSHDRTKEQYDNLMKDNAQLETQISRYKLQITQQKEELSARLKEEQLQELISRLQKSEMNLRTELSRVEERLRRETDALKIVENQLRERESMYEENSEERQRIQKELEALQALSKSLTNENKTLRDEKISYNERIEFLQKKIVEKDQQIRDLSESLDHFKQKYEETRDRLQQEISLETEKSRELEKIVRKVHELSDSLPKRESEMSTNGTRSRVSMQIQSSASSSKRTSGIPSNSETSSSRKTPPSTRRKNS